MYKQPNRQEPTDDFGNGISAVYEALEIDSFITCVRAMIRFVVDGNEHQVMDESSLQHYGII